MKNLVKSFGHGIIIGLGIIFILFLAGVTYAAVSTANSGDTLTATIWNDMKDIVNSNETKLINISSVGDNVGIGVLNPTSELEVNGVIKSKSVNRNYCYGTSYTGHDMYSATWTNLNGFSGCNIETFGRQLKITMDFSVYGIYHGGIRLIDNSTGVIYGTQATYGFDWVMPTSNIWTKRTITRIIDVPAGVHNFGVQARSQVDGSRFYIHPGTESDDYSGFHLIIEEM